MASEVKNAYSSKTPQWEHAGYQVLKVGGTTSFLFSFSLPFFSLCFLFPFFSSPIYPYASFIHPGNLASVVDKRILTGLAGKLIDRLCIGLVCIDYLKINLGFNYGIHKTNFQKMRGQYSAGTVFPRVGGIGPLIPMVVTPCLRPKDIQIHMQCISLAR